MKRKPSRSVTAYLLLLTLFVAAVGLTAHFSGTASASAAAPVAPFEAFREAVLHHMRSDIGLLILQLIVILSLVRLVGWIFKKMKQPTVIGEIVAGILLGPSLLGWLWPQGFAWLFPEHSLPNIELLSQFGLILFMFTIGMELRIKDIRARARQALVISQAGIFIPFLLGLALSFYTHPNYAAQTPFLPYALFCGIAMSITAFPVLARIIQERSLGRTPLGKLSLSTAAAGDIAAWMMLAAIMAVTQSGSFTGALFNILFLGVYSVLIFFVLRPLFDVVGRLYNRQEVVSKALVGVIFILLLVSSYFTELLSMHALFGAFMLGLVMPGDLKFRRVLNEKVEDVSLSLFLPLFFVSSGLRTSFGLIDSAQLWVLFIIFTVVAIVGKVGGTYLFARLCGISVKESLYLGAFMNTRGLMELVVLRIGLDLGILPPVIFSILVLMTLVTTFMTTPLVHLIDFLYKHFKWEKASPLTAGAAKYKVLLSFGLPRTGQKLVDVAQQIFSPHRRDTDLNLLHITMNSDVNPINEEEYFRENFAPLLQEARKRDINLTPIHRISDNPSEEIIRTANKGQYSMLMVGAGLNLSNRDEDRELIHMRAHLLRRWQKLSISTPEALLSAKTMFQDKMAKFVTLTEGSVGILIDRGKKHTGQVLLAVHSAADLRLLPFARNLAAYRGERLFIKPLDGFLLEQAQTQGVTLLRGGALAEALPEFDFLFISFGTWNLLLDEHLGDLDYLPDTLIIHSHKEHFFEDTI